MQSTKHKTRVSLKCFFFYKKSYKAETNGSKMVKFGANVTQTALKDLNLAQTGNYDQVLNLKYTCGSLSQDYPKSCHVSDRLHTKVLFLKLSFLCWSFTYTNL